VRRIGDAVCGGAGVGGAVGEERRAALEPSDRVAEALLRVVEAREVGRPRGRAAELCQTAAVERELARGVVARGLREPCREGVGGVETSEGEEHLEFALVETLGVRGRAPHVGDEVGPVPARGVEMEPARGFPGARPPQELSEEPRFAVETGRRGMVRLLVLLHLERALVAVPDAGEVGPARLRPEAPAFRDAEGERVERRVARLEDRVGDRRAVRGGVLRELREGRVSRGDGADERLLLRRVPDRRRLVEPARLGETAREPEAGRRRGGSVGLGAARLFDRLVVTPEEREALGAAESRDDAVGARSREREERRRGVVELRLLEEPHRVGEGGHRAETLHEPSAGGPHPARRRGTSSVPTPRASGSIPR
jgi:hypothetical protein